LSHSNKIKNLKPNKNSRFKQGYLDISKSLKYLGSGPVIYRSGLELKLFELFENSDAYTGWESEPNLGIKYELHGKVRSYYPDAIFYHKNGVKYVCEIKPFSETVSPRHKKHSTQKRALEVFEKNIAKWTAAKKWAEANGYEFCILTEKFLNKLK